MTKQEEKTPPVQEDFQLIEFSLVPIEWIQKLYPDSWQKYTLRTVNPSEDMRGDA